MLTYGDVKDAARRIAGVVRPVTVTAAVPGEVALALEFMQVTGSFKARGAANYVAALREGGAMPGAGLITSTGRNADLGFAWAAGRYGVPVTSFLPLAAPPLKAARLRALGADVRLVEGDPVEASRAFAAQSGAVDAYEADVRLSSAGAGTLTLEIAEAVSGLDTIVCAVGAGGMFSGITAAADHLGIRVVAVEPEGCQALYAALKAGQIVDVPVESVASESLGSLQVIPDAFAWARQADVRSVLVDDQAIIGARQALWDERRLCVEHGSAAPLAALASGAYTPSPGEKAAVVLCGGNTNPADLA
ncbi:pyridoxal-phosphate dependent enzyme [Nonomuraea sp. NPDC059194]|uniref:pyridoxal-phosphate dependent enzyme n=1 Tax=Nonomuraea sp. NPDC059194 TaxID=3346764 RepID=UPI0036B585E5